MYQDGQIIRRTVRSSSPNQIPQLTPPMELKLIQMWLHGKSGASRRAYLTDVQHFLDFCQKRLDNIELADIQDWDTFLEQKYAPASRKRKLAAIKSLFSFAHQNKLLADNPGSALSTPKTKDAIAEKILTEEEWSKLLNAEPNRQHQLMLQPRYYQSLFAYSSWGIRCEVL